VLMNQNSSQQRCFSLMDDFDEALEYLDDLRESGVTNMYGAGAYLMEEFHVTRYDARNILKHWMDTFEERHSV